MSTLKICQDRFVHSSQPLQKYLERFKPQFPTEVKYQSFDDNPAKVPTVDHELI